MIDKIHSLGAVRGRVEIPETSGHWETAYAARSLPLVRGWIRQVDTQLNGATFYNGPPSPSTYEAWLLRNTVQYVAVPDTPLTDPGSFEVAAIDRHPTFLKLVWRNDAWRLYAVADFHPVVAPPGRLHRIGASELELSAPAHAHLVINLRWFSWLALHSDDAGACITPDPDGQVELNTTRGGTYRIGSSLFDRSGHC
jgi:hypothetical protein